MWLSIFGYSEVEREQDLIKWQRQKCSDLGRSIPRLSFSSNRTSGWPFPSHFGNGPTINCRVSRQKGISRNCDRWKSCSDTWSRGDWLSFDNAPPSTSKTRDLEFRGHFFWIGPWTWWLRPSCLARLRWTITCIKTPISATRSPAKNHSPSEFHPVAGVPFPSSRMGPPSTLGRSKVKSGRLFTSTSICMSDPTRQTLAWHRNPGWVTILSEYILWVHLGANWWKSSRERTKHISVGEIDVHNCSESQWFPRYHCSFKGDQIQHQALHDRSTYSIVGMTQKSGG
jgi:hypothetical protein